MACSSNHVRDIESIYSKNDKQFHSITEQNIHKYEELVFTLYNGCKHDKKLFNKIYAKLQKRGDIIVKKSFLVYVYQKMIKENKIESNQRFWLMLQKCPSRNLSGVVVLRFYFHRTLTVKVSVANTIVTIVPMNL